MSKLYDSYNTNDDNVGAIHGLNLRTQIFTASDNYGIGYVKLLLLRVGNPGSTKVSIFSTTANLPNVELVSATVDGDTFTTNVAGNWETISFSTTITLVSGTVYAIVLEAASGDGSNYVNWREDQTSSAYAGGFDAYSSDGGSNWNDTAPFNTYDFMFETYGDFGSPVDKSYSKKLLAIGSDSLWQEATAGTMSELTAANGDIDTAVKLNGTVAFQKLFIANESNLKIADFVNTKLSTTDISSGANLPPDRGIILTGGSSGATMVVDYINAINGTCLAYGKRTSTATFTSGETVTGTNPTDSVYAGGVSFVLNAAEVGAPHWYDWTVYGGDATNFGAMPTEAYLVCNFMGCLMLSGDANYPHQWYMSRQLNPFDWLYAQDDAQSAVAGNDADAGEVGDIIKVNIPYKDDYVIHACANTLWYMTGHPCAGGTIVELDLTTGILGDRAYCWDDKGNLYMMCTVGLLRVPPGFGQPENITIDIWPNFISDLAFDSSLHRITLAFNPEDHGIHIFKTTLADGTSSAWWYDLRTDGLFPDSYSADHGMLSAVYYQSESPTYRKLLSGCNDGYIRYWDKSTHNDDSTAIDSYVGFAPLSLSTHTRKDGILTNIDMITGGGDASGTEIDSSDVYCKVHVARTAAGIKEKLDAGATPKITKTFSAPGYKKDNLDRRSVRGQWGGIVVGNSTAAQSWSMERLIVDTKEVGRSL